jgi:hypothetical protein
LHSERVFFFSWRLVVSNAGDIPQPSSYQIPEINIGIQLGYKAAKNNLHKETASARFYFVIAPD